MINIPITFNSDEKGYFDRECPNEECLFTFKVFMEDWKDKVSDETVYCPMCGHVDTSDKWYTQQQLDEIHEIASNYALSYAQKELDKSFKKLEQSTRNSKFVKITYKPDKKVSFINNPIGQSSDWEQEIKCPVCDVNYSVIGTAYFCPCCGQNIVENVFDSSMDGIFKMIESMPQMQDMFTHTYNQDIAVSMCRSILENSLGDIVSAFQKFAESCYKSISNKKVRSNDFQIIEKGSDLFREACGKSYTDWISCNEIKILTVMFQKRHIFEHNGGIVDASYINKSGDMKFSLGQRMVIKSEDVKLFIDIIKKLSVGIKSVKGSKNS